MRNSSALPPRSRILIVRLSSIGDVLHTTTVVHNLRRLAPDAEITWLASPPASTLLETNPDIDRLLVFDRRPIDEAGAHLRLRTCWRELKKARALLAPYTFDIALDLQGLFLTGLLTRLSKAPRRIGIHERHEGNPLFMTEMAPDIPDPHKIRRYYTALAPLGFPQETLRPGPVLCLPPALSGFAADFWAAHGIDAARPILIVCVRTTWPDKNWPPARFGEALRAVPEQVQIVFTGAKGDRPFIEEAQRAIGGARPSLSIAGETGLLELAALMKSAALLLTGDTGPSTSPRPSARRRSPSGARRAPPSTARSRAATPSSRAPIPAAPAAARTAKRKTTPAWRPSRRQTLRKNSLKCWRC